MPNTLSKIFVKIHSSSLYFKMNCFQIVIAISILVCMAISYYQFVPLIQIWATIFIILDLLIRCIINDEPYFQKKENILDMILVMMFSLCIVVSSSLWMTTSKLLSLGVSISILFRYLLQRRQNKQIEIHQISGNQQIIEQSSDF